MINKEAIEKAADICSDDFYEEQYHVVKLAFKDGVNWLRERLWHDAKEDMPYHNAICLCYDELYEQYRLLRYDDIDKHWSDAIFDVREPIGEYRITHWLYIDDLIKK